MNKKINNFLIAICSLFLCVGIVNAEIDYKTECKGKSGNDLLACCEKVEDHDNKVACRNTAFKKCGDANGLNNKTSCCSTFTDELDRMACNEYVRGVCTPADSVEMNKAAMKVKISYEPVDVLDPMNPKVTYFMIDIKIYNLPKDLIVKVDNSDGYSYVVDSDSANKNGIITLRSENTDEVKKFNFKIISNGLCNGRELRKLSLTIPKYNYYSQRSVCKEVPSYYLCQKYINFDVDSTKFLDNVTKYKEKGNKNTDKESTNSQKTVNKTINTISNNKYLIVAIIIAAGIVASYFVIKTNKRKGDK